MISVLFLVHIILFVFNVEHEAPEIRERAIGHIQSKFQSCSTDLDELVVDVRFLIKNLFKWFQIKPITHQKQAFEIILALMKVN